MREVSASAQHLSLGQACRVSVRSPFQRKSRIPFVPIELSREATQLWPGRKDMPTPESIATILKATEENPALRLEILSWLRRTAVARGQELHSYVGMLIAIIAISVSVSAEFPPVAIILMLLALVALYWASVMSTAVIVELGERSRHAAVWLAALEDAIRTEPQRRRWWKRSRNAGS